MGTLLSTGAVKEASLLERFCQGDVDAFEELFRLHQRVVYGWILRIVRDRGAAEELTVETFWRIYKARARFNATHGFEPWARRVATRAALDWLRARRPECQLTAEVTSAQGGWNADPGVTAEIRLKTAQAFERLPPKLRITATLAIVEGQTQKDVADALGISVSAVKLRIFRAVRMLRDDLERWGIRP